MWQVPIGYLDTFQLNLDEAICSIIGIATASTLKYISGIRLAAAKTDTYSNPFIRDVIEVGDKAEDLLQYSNFFDLTKVSEDDMERPLFIHLDMSSSKDKTGIAGVWITGKEATSKPILTGNESDMELVNLENSIEAGSLSFKLAFSVSIQAPKGARVSFTKNRLFINWLREQGFNIKKISADTYQSTATLQELRSDGFETEILSVDRTTSIDGKRKVCLPYAYLQTAIYERRIKIYNKCDLLTTELLELERESDGHINHPENGKYGSKDQADALCGATFLASKYAVEYAKDYGEQLNATTEANAEEENDNLRRQKYMEDFENELLKLNGSLKPLKRTQQEQEE